MNDVEIFNAAAKNEGDTSNAHERDCQWVWLVGHFLCEVEVRARLQDILAGQRPTYLKRPYFFL